MKKIIWFRRSIGTRRWRKGQFGVLICLFFFLVGSSEVSGAVENEEAIGQEETIDQEETSEWMEDILEELDYGNLEVYLDEEFPSKVSFEEVVESLFSEGLGAGTREKVTTYVYEIFFFELANGKDYFVQILCFAILFAMLQKLLVMKNSYVSDVSFLMVYAAIMALLLQSFSLMSQQAMEGLDSMIQFMTALIPVYAGTLLFTGCTATAAVFYEVSFVLIAVIEWAMKYFFVPGIHIYLILSFLNPLLGDDRLGGVCQLLEDFLMFLQKAAFAIIGGFTAVQSLLTPAQDRVSQSSVLKGLSSIPGIGNSFGTAGDVLVSCGMLIKNSVGVAALIFLLAVSLMPVIKTFIFTLLYKVLGAVLMPVADKRLVKGISGVESASRLYEKVVFNSFVLFFLVIAMITATTSFFN